MSVEASRIEWWAREALSRASRTGPNPTQPQPQSTVFIDGQNITGTASDGNNGSSIGSAFLTAAGGYLQRLGTFEPVFNQPTVVTLLSDQQTTDYWILTPHLIGAGSLKVNGTLVQAGSATIGVFTPRNRVAGTRNTITAQGQSGAFWTPFIGMLVNDTTVNAWFRIHADLGGATAVITEPVASTFNTVPIVPAYVTIANGDSLVIYSMSKIYPAFSSVGSVSNTIKSGTYQRVDFSYPFMRADTWSVNECTFSGSILTTGNGLGFLKNCFFKSSGLWQGTGTFIAGGMLSSSAVMNVTSQGSSVLDGDFLCDASSLHFGPRQQVGRVSLSAGVDFDYSGILIECGTADTPGVYYGDTFIWGVGNLALRGGAKLFIQSAATAANIMLLTGGFTIDGASTAYPWVGGGTHAYGAAVAITGANVDTNLSLSNPQTGTMIAKRA